MSSIGAVFYRGPSMLTGDPIIGILSGLEGESNNPKTGPMVQVYLLRPDLTPMEAIRAGADEAICGDCKLRWQPNRGGKCYVTPFMGPTQIWKKFRAGHHIEANWPEAEAIVEGRMLRIAAYGDPSSAPYEIWRRLLQSAAGFVAYTHQWRTCDPRFKTFCMASVDTEDEFHAAHLAGWRTFRIRLSTDSLLASPKYGRGSNQHARRATSSTPLEIVCPASDEAGHRVTCQQCRLCQGTSKPARSIAIVAHGKPSNLKLFGIRPAAWFGKSNSPLHVDEVRP